MLHLLIDATSERIEKNKIYEFLEGLPAKIGMKKIAGPIVSEQFSSFSGAVLIAESHISLHQISDKIFIDVFSCRDFEAEEVVEELKNKLGLKILQKRCLKRGPP